MGRSHNDYVLFKQAASPLSIPSSPNDFTNDLLVRCLLFPPRGACSTDGSGAANSLADGQGHAAGGTRTCPNLGRAQSANGASGRVAGDRLVRHILYARGDALLLLGLDFGGAVFPWSSPKVVCLIVFGTAMVGFFLYSETRLAKHPLMHLGVFKGRSNIAAFVVGLMHGMVFAVVEYYLPLYFQSAKQASPIRSGILPLPAVVTCAAMDIASGDYMHQTGRYREVIWVGLILLTAGAGSLTSFDASTPLGTLVGLQMLCGAGAGPLFSAPIISIQNSVNQADTAAATATFGFSRNVATSVAIVVGGVLFQNSMNAQAGDLRSAGLSAATVNSLSGKNAAGNINVLQTVANVTQQTVIRTAFAHSFHDMWIVCTCLAAVGLVAGCFVQQKVLRTEHTETKTGLQNMNERAQ